jgi:hypothetical protein
MIELSPEVYRQFQRILRSRKKNATRAQRVRHIDSTYGKYAGKSSLVQALLRERRADLTREENKLRRRNG